MTTYFLIAIVVLIVLFIGRMILTARNERDTQARLNYERHMYERTRDTDTSQVSTGERAGHRRASEYSWGREGEGA